MASLISPSGRSFTIRPDRDTLVGRDPDNHIVLKDDSVSRHHAAVTITDGRLYVRDLNSTNGTFVSGRRVVNRAEVLDAQGIRFGNVDLRLEAGVERALVSAISVFCTKCGGRISNIASKSPQCGAARFAPIASGQPAMMIVSSARIPRRPHHFTQLSRRIMADCQQWERERALLLSAVSSINDAVLLLDGNGRILFANPEALGRLGMADGVAIGRSIEGVLGRDHPLVRLSGSALRAQTELHNVPMDMNGPNSPKFLVSLMAMDLGAGRRGSLMVLRDASSVEDLEETLNFSRILARQGRLLSGIGHQLRNPLQAIGLQLELLADDARSGRPLSERIASIRGEIGRVTRTVSALLRFIRLERLEPSRFALNNLIREVAARQAGSRRQQISYNLNDAVGQLEGDRALLGEALENVINNAMEATPGGRAINVGTALVGGAVEIVVADQGKGIAPEHMAGIFDFGFTTKAGGGGIGLPMAMRVIDLHRGTLRVNSRQGHGTTVRITLPSRQPAALSAPVAA